MELAPAGGTVIHLRGLPTKATKEDVVEFLKEWQPAAVYLVFTTRRSSGEAYVVFETREQAEGACSKDKDIFGPKFGERYVRVSIQEDATPADLHSLEGVPKASKPRRPHQKMESVIKVTGLPRGITTAEVLQLFWGWQVKPGGAFLRDATNPAAAVAAAAAATAAAAAAAAGDSAPASSGRGSGSKTSNSAAATTTGNAAASAPSPSASAELRSEAFIDFEHAEHAATAVSTRHGTTITTSAGMFQLAVCRASKAEWDSVVEASRGGAAGGDGIVRVRGLPPRTAPGDVIAFFQGYRVKPGGVHLQPCTDSQHSKLALVVFDSPEEAARAMERDRQKLGEAFGDHCCMLDLISRAEFDQELQRFRLPGSGGNGNSSSSGGTAVGGAGTTLGRVGSTALQSSGALSMQPSMPSGSMSMSLTGMPPLGMGLPGMGMLPQAAAAAAGYMTPGLPHIPHSAMLPGVAFGAGGFFPGLHPGWPPGAVRMAAAAFGAAPGVSSMFAAPQWPGMPPAQLNPASARYMVQDLTTGQKVFLDPRFNLSGYGALPPGPASCSVVATAGTTPGATATGPAGSQQTQAQSGEEAASGGRRAAEPSEDSSGLKPGRGGPSGGTGTGTATGTAGQSSEPTPGGGARGSGNGNGSSGNRCSVAQAGAVAGAPAKDGVGASVHGGAAAAGAGDGRGSSEQIDGQEADAEPQATRHRHSHHHHHHHHGHHHHHHHHYRGRAGANGNGSSSGEEGRTNGGGSGGGSNDGGSNDGSGADEPAGNGRSSNMKAAGDNSSGNNPAGGAAAEGGSSGEGSGADDGAAARTSGSAFSRQAGPGEGEPGGVADMEEDAAAPDNGPSVQWRQQPQHRRPATQPGQQQRVDGSLPAGPSGVHEKNHVHAHSPDDPAALHPEEAPPPQKRARDH
ncbi:hypothetical protein ABPG77_000160 [Micractinium sp. CCAP 211/92]